MINVPAGAVPAALPHFTIEWADDCCSWETWFEPPNGSGMEATALSAQPLAFEFVAPAARLDRLRVLLATYARTNTVDLLCVIFDPAGAEVGRAVTPADAIADNSRTAVADLTGIVFSVGAKYRIELSCADATPHDTFAVYLTTLRGGCYQTPRRIAAFRDDRLFAWRPEEWDGTPPMPRPRAVAALLGPPAERIEAARKVTAAFRAIFPGDDLAILEPESLSWLWRSLAGADVAILVEPDGGDLASDTGFDALCFALHRRGVCTISLGDDLPDGAGSVRILGGLGTRLRDRARTAQRCHYTLALDPPRIAAADDAADSPLVGTPGSLAGLVEAVRRRRMPRVAIVSVLYKKADIISTFIDCVLRQSYPGRIDLVLVDDKSPDGDAAIARAEMAAIDRSGIANRTVRLIENDANLGNCGSRLAGLEAEAEADIYIVIDCDCLINRDFVAAHVFEHGRDDVDVVIGPLNIEANDRDPRALLHHLERDPERVVAESGLQDPIQPDGFLNCITRNFSAKRRVLQTEPLFDLDFSYSSKPGSGFGWEDVEMGYRLYARGAVIRRSELAFSVHATHPSSVPDTMKIAGSMRNFERLFAKHPEMERVARRWALDTYDRILRWADDHDIDGGDERQRLERRFAGALEEHGPLVRSLRPAARRLRILSYRWHVSHQYELYKLPHDFTLVTHAGDNGMIDQWSFDQRPLRPNVRMIPLAYVDPAEYDVILLHFDENVLHPNLCNNVIPSSWGDPFSRLIATPDLPKVAICHGTPQFAGQYGLQPARIAEFEVYEAERRALVDLLAGAGVRVVCNSHQALSEWGFAEGRVIWHGFDPQQFPPAIYLRQVLALEPDRHRPHYRGFWEHAEVERRLDPDIRIETAAHRGAPIERRGTNAFATRNFRAYVDRIREFTVYLNTTLRSPMPRSRGEAMMTGVIPVCLRNHDVERFIDPGKNGFYSEDPAELADWINFLFRNPGEIRRIGGAARHTATDLFNHDRYLGHWQRLLAEAVG